MSTYNVVIGGASGFLGRALATAFRSAGARVSVVGRDREHLQKQLPGMDAYATWSDRDATLNVVAEADCLINLAGANVGELRWTDKNKQLFVRSRLESTDRCIDLLHSSAQRRADLGKNIVFVSASAVGIYGFCGDEWKTEDDAPGSDFLARLCSDWEQLARQASAIARVINPRIGVVLDKDHGALAKLLLPFKLFVGGPLGRGTQWMSWIHRDDLVRAILFGIHTPTIDGAFNCVAPNPVTMDEFARTLAEALHRPGMMRVPEFALKLALGEQHSIVTRGQRATASMLLNAGFQFNFASCKDCVNDLLFTTQNISHS